MVQTIMERPRFGNLRAAPNHRLGEVVEVLRNRASGFHDEIVDVRDVSMSPDDGALHVGREATELQPWALSQLGSKLGIPGNYLAKCEPEIRAQNVNHWLSKESGKLLLRMDGNEVRAVLSTRYQSVSNEDLALSLAQTLPEDRPVRFELTETHFELQIIGESGMQVDLLHRGLHLTNSEVGAASVSLSALIYRTVCLNGLIMGHGMFTFARRHIGRVDLNEVVQGEVTRLLDASGEAAGQFQNTLNVRMPDQFKALERVVERYELNKEQAQAMQLAFNAEPGETLFHTINAVTRAGNDEALSLDHRRQLQETGGRLLTLASEGRRWLD
jgi:hypothetical protein